jgi:hypothetical protein
VQIANKGSGASDADSRTQPVVWVSRLVTREVRAERRGNPQWWAIASVR